MQIEVYGSGSTGNAYGISDGKTKLMLECGVKLKELNKYSGYSLDTFDAVITSHSHGDHSATLYEMLKRGKPVYCTAETSSVYELSGEGVHTIDDQASIVLKTFIIVPFPLIHKHTITMADCPCYGFLVYSKETHETLLFATDTMYIPQKFSNKLNYIMLETNYFEKYLDTLSDFIDARRLQTHMSVETAIKFLKLQDLSSVKAIIGLHLSSAKTEKAEVLRALRRATGKRCYVAEAGLVVNWGGIQT